MEEGIPSVKSERIGHTLIDIIINSINYLRIKNCSFLSFPILRNKENISNLIIEFAQQIT